MRKDLFGVLALLVGSALFAGCTTGPEGTEEHYIKLSDAVCTFTEDGGETQVIDVRANPEWSFESGASWLKVSEGEGSTLVVSADPNTDGERSAEITLQAGEATASIRVYQLGARGLSARYRLLEQLNSAVMSPSGRYAGGFTASIAPDDSWQYSPTIVDLETGEVYEFGPYPESLHYLTQTMAITDQGLLFISDGFHGGQIAIDLTGNIFIPEAPAGFTNKPQIQGTSADGKYWVGFGMKGKLFEDPAPQKALLWIDGVPHELPWPELNYRNEEAWYGGMARGISANGEIIYGTSWENSDFGMLYWINNGTSTAAPKWVGHDVKEVWEETMKMSDGTEYTTHLVNGLICQAQLTKISPNGKWIASSYRTETPADDRISIVTTQKAAFFNTETETTVIVEDYGESVGVHVTDDGIAFIGIGTLGISSGKVYDLNTGTDLGDTQDWVYDKYGIIIPAGYINYISPDGRFVLGTKAESSAMGVSFINWYIAPPLAK